MKRLTFLAHFILCLAFSAAFFFAWQRGVPQLVWNSDARWFGAAIAALVVSTAVWLGWQAWKADSVPRYKFHTPATPWTADSSFGHDAEMYCPSIGMLGTVFGLSHAFATAGDQMAMIHSGFAAFFSTGCGIVGMLIVRAMWSNLERGMRRTQ